MSRKAIAAVEAAHRAADKLAAIGENKMAEDVRRVCRQNSAYRQTCKRLHTDNMALRGASAQ